MTTFRVEIRTLTPLHIGTGAELRYDFDYVVHQGRTWRLHVDRILEARYDARAQGAIPLPGRMLTANDFQQRPEFFRYVATGVPRRAKTYAALRECIKDPWDRPYIPGSSLKGALRTALAWAGWSELHLPLKRNLIGHRAKFAAQPLERRIFGPNPNRDLLRALQVSDLFGPQKPGQGVGVLDVQVVTRQGFKAPIPIEAVVQQTFTGTLKVDDYLLSAVAQQLGFADRRHWLTNDFLPRLRRYARQRLEALSAHFAAFARSGVPGADDLVRFYQKLLNTTLPANMTFLQLGWGTGWDGKTLWTHLQQNPQLFEALIRDFRLQRRPKGAPPRRPGAPFPSSRRVVVRRQRIAAPLGWVVLALE